MSDNDEEVDSNYINIINCDMWIDITNASFSVNVDKKYRFCVVIFNQYFTQYCVLALLKHYRNPQNFFKTLRRNNASLDTISMYGFKTNCHCSVKSISNMSESK